MRIISDHKDYYDSASAHGVDVTRVFERKSEIIKMETNKISELNLNKCDCNALVSGSRRIGYAKDTIFKSSILFFCGQSIPFVQISYKRKIKGLKKENYIFWSEDSVENHIKEHHPEYCTNVFNAKENKNSFYSIKLNKSAIKDHFSQQNLNGFLSELSHDINSPYFVVELKNNSRPSYIKSKKETKIVITKNIRLLDIEFQKVIDAFTCFQGISQYCFGVLSNIENKNDEIEDKYKLAGKGFDPKYGFRTRPGTGKKDKKK